jgi:tRNA threonylcarbamoyladenosine biosynthesis protein TsaB
MALILNIDTAVEIASVCLAKDGEVVAFLKNEQQNNHAEWLHVAIKNIIETSGVPLNTLDAVAVTEGPGSYTGLRISMATAKGICFALDKPLICLNTLQVMANAAKNIDLSKNKAGLLCPMIDARRMEVFTALYSYDLTEIKKSSALILDATSFEEELALQQIWFFGNGSEKFKNIKKNTNAFFQQVTTEASSMVSLAENKFIKREFADLAYAEPQYSKEFYSPVKK